MRQPISTKLPPAVASGIGTPEFVANVSLANDEMHAPNIVERANSNCQLKNNNNKMEIY
jgi:hypothetical protein